jgi:hypothetical protein
MLGKSVSQVIGTGEVVVGPVSDSNPSSVSVSAFASTVKKQSNTVKDQANVDCKRVRYTICN